MNLVDVLKTSNICLDPIVRSKGLPFMVDSSVGSNLVQFGGSFSFLRFTRFEVRFLGPKKRFGRFEVQF